MKKLILIFTVSLLAGMFVPSVVYSQQVQEDQPQKVMKLWTLEKCVNQFSIDDTVGTSVGYQYWFVDKNFLDGQTLKMSVVKPHEATHAPHKHFEDEFFFVLEGTAQFYLDGDSVVASPYASFYCPSGIEHGIRNVGDSELKYLVIKKYSMEK
jgi:mannose-6-phosphate isomerase-like protein (cupin superfamily)